MNKILLFAILCTSTSTWAESFRLTCITSIRHACFVESGCKSIKDKEPSTYTIDYKSNSKISMSHFIGSTQMSSWNAVNIGGNSDKYILAEQGMSPVLTLTNDLKRFSYIGDDGISQYNSNLNLNKKPDEDMGGQIRTGTCIRNP
jgi:hypothetical protein